MEENESLYDGSKFTEYEYEFVKQLTIYRVLAKEFDLPKINHLRGIKRMQMQIIGMRKFFQVNNLEDYKPIDNSNISWIKDKKTVRIFTIN